MQKNYKNSPNSRIDELDSMNDEYNNNRSLDIHLEKVKLFFFKF